jgi:hypothetical protein
MIEAQADPLDQRRQVPGIDRLAVDRGLPADRVDPGAPGPGRSQRVGGERHREAGRGFALPCIGFDDLVKAIEHRILGLLTPVRMDRGVTIIGFAGATVVV